MLLCSDPKELFPGRRAVAYVFVVYSLVSIARPEVFRATQLQRLVMNTTAINHNVKPRSSGSQGAPGTHLPAQYGLNSTAPNHRGRRGPHPGDILFWVACVGGAGLLLFLAT
jgi:hypothetical protein